MSSVVGIRKPVLRRRFLLTAGGTAAVTALLAWSLAGKGHEFEAALRAAPLATLAVVTLLQTVALVSRSEAWLACVRAAGGTVGRRRLYHAASVGYVGSVVNSHLGVAARIAALRRSAPAQTPRLPALLGAEVPIAMVEAGLAAIFSFTLVGPLGLPWWFPLAAFAVVGAGALGFGRMSRSGRRSFWRGLAVMGSLRGQARVSGLMMVAVFAQIARNWIVLHALGVDASVFDAIAVLIAMVALSQLPVGPSLGAAATVVVLGPHGVALAAAAGVLLTATGTAGALLYAAWALADRLPWPRLARRLHARARRRALRPLAAAWSALGALPLPERRSAELAYCGGLSALQVRRLVWVPVRQGAAA